MATLAPPPPRRRPPAPTREDIRGQLLKMFQHRTFSRSARLRRFLEFVVETTIEGRAHELKEFTVAIHAFDKDESFDPRIDPIVRVEAGRLRQRINEYYKENPEDRILIRLRKRGYRPILRWMKRSDRIDNAPSSIGDHHFESTPARTIALLDFENLTGDPRHDQFSKAIPKRLATLLPGSTNFRPAGETYDSDDAGRVRADFLLRGSVQRNGRRVRIIASVLRGDDGLQVWSQAFDRRFEDDLFELQDSVARAIASALASGL